MVIMNARVHIVVICGITVRRHDEAHSREESFEADDGTEVDPMASLRPRSELARAAHLAIDRISILECRYFERIMHSKSCDCCAKAELNNVE